MARDKNIELPKLNFVVYRRDTIFDGVYTNEGRPHDKKIGRFSTIDQAMDCIAEKVHLDKFSSYKEAADNYEKNAKAKDSDLLDSDFEICYYYVNLKDGVNINKQLEQMGVNPHGGYGGDMYTGLHSKNAEFEPFGGLFAGVRGIETKQSYDFKEICVFYGTHIVDEKALRNDADPRIGDIVDKISERFVDSPVRVSMEVQMENANAMKDKQPFKRTNAEKNMPKKGNMAIE